ncbi:hypothetical protein B0J12DRAFT_367530 [Macrophomina phaseolina]|uniref:Uncharacterized protein n=1 Tax=Macrophomina phaseolina TaxID=35725 RepID=A0ABQ8GJL8_9PEZI|nr:hypothetical protein B0J12DRAFT_367530 [Macrophomina phaseolina]
MYLSLQPRNEWIAHTYTLTDNQATETKKQTTNQAHSQPRQCPTAEEEEEKKKKKRERERKCHLSQPCSENFAAAAAASKQAAEIPQSCFPPLSLRILAPEGGGLPEPPNPALCSLSPPPRPALPCPGVLVPYPRPSHAAPNRFLRPTTALCCPVALWAPNRVFFLHSCAEHTYVLFSFFLELLSVLFLEIFFFFSLSLFAPS